MARGETPGQRYTVTCPSCGRDTLVVREIYSEIPRFGRTVIVSMLCSKCGYRVNDSISLESKGPKRIEFKVLIPADLSARLIRSETSYIVVPELGLELKPGPRSEAFITNLEGLLERFLQVAEQLESTSGGKKGEKTKALLKRLRRAMDGGIPFTVIVEDEAGNSAVIPANQFER